MFNKILYNLLICGLLLLAHWPRLLPQFVYNRTCAIACPFLLFVASLEQISPALIQPDNSFTLNVTQVHWALVLKLEQLVNSNSSIPPLPTSWQYTAACPGLKFWLLNFYYQHPWGPHISFLMIVIKYPELVEETTIEIKENKSMLLPHRAVYFRTVTSACWWILWYFMYRYLCWLKNWNKTVHICIGYWQVWGNMK